MSINKAQPVNRFSVLFGEKNSEGKGKGVAFPSPQFPARPKACSQAKYGLSATAVFGIKLNSLHNLQIMTT